MNRKHLISSIALVLFASFITGCNSPSTPSTPSLPDLTGRWNGVFGSDGNREVLLLTQNGSTLSGSSFFENEQGQKLSGGHGVISGQVLTASDVTFTISRDNTIFEWHGTVNSSQTVLTGKFVGYSNDATYYKAR